MDWDGVFFNPDTLTAWRIAVKRLTVGDAANMGTLEDEIAQRDDLAGRVYLRLAQDYPLLRYGTRAVECAALSSAPTQEESGAFTFPDDVDWQPFVLTEDSFMALDEWFFWEWYTLVVLKNPHHDHTYEILKKNAQTAAQRSASASTTTDSTPTAPSSAAS